MKTMRRYYDYEGGEAYWSGIIEIRPFSEGKSAVVLEETIFYPEGGGQDSDRGTINGVPLDGVIEKEGEILHIFSEKNGEKLALGGAELVLDAARRKDLTVQHTGQHLLSGVTLRLTGFPTVSMHIGAEICTIDVEAKALSMETLAEIEDAVQIAIEENHPIMTHLCPPENAESFPLRKKIPQTGEIVRIVEIQGYDFSPCCGTHLKSTGQLGMLRVLGAEKYKGMTRVRFIAGARVLRESRLLRRNAEMISQALKTPVFEIGDGVLALLEKTGKMERELKRFQDEDAGRKARNLAAAVMPESEKGNARIITASYTDADFDEVLRIGRAAQKLTPAILVLASETEVKFAAFCSQKDRDIRLLLQEAFEKNNGKGGGGASFFQGVFENADALHKFIAALNGVK
jgi:alanyl-tRNA synthetase